MSVNHLETLNKDERGGGRRGAAACSGSTLKGITTVEGRGAVELQDAWAEVEVWSQHILSDCCCEPQKLPRLCHTKSSCGLSSLIEARAQGRQAQNDHIVTVFILQRYNFAHSISLLVTPLSCILVIRDKKRTPLARCLLKFSFPRRGSASLQPSVEGLKHPHLRESFRSLPAVITCWKLHVFNVSFLVREHKYLLFCSPCFHMERRCPCKASDFIKMVAGLGY